MNDVRNLMDTLHTHMEYREFETAIRAPAGAPPVLQRNRPRSEHLAPSADLVAERAPSPSARPSLLGRYAPTPAPAGPPQAARRLPLAEVFTRLERRKP